MSAWCRSGTLSGARQPACSTSPPLLPGTALQVSYKTLGFLPGRARQEGEIEPINSTTFQVGRRGVKNCAVCLL